MVDIRTISATVAFYDRPTGLRTSDACLDRVPEDLDEMVQSLVGSSERGRTAGPTEFGSDERAREID
jgi:hypothetical protein